LVSHFIRVCLLLVFGVFVACAIRAEPAPVVPGYEIRFPRDAGSHPEFRTEWWYVTGWVQDAEGQ
jgi:predicted secreted hydrolase